MERVVEVVEAEPARNAAEPFALACDKELVCAFGEEGREPSIVFGRFEVKQGLERPAGGCEQFRGARMRATQRRDAAA